MVVGELAEAVDLLVVGGGPGGYAAAIRAAQLGREVTLVERGLVGGVCLHVGCIPSKALIELAAAAHRTRELEAAGLDVDGVSVSLARFQAWRAELCATLARGVDELLAKGSVRIVEGHARFNRPDRVAVETPDDRALFFEFEHAIVATGSRPIELPDLPFDGARVLDSTGALALTEVPASVAVIGAGYIGLELGTAFAKLGARVTVVERSTACWRASTPRSPRRCCAACGRSASTFARNRPRAWPTTARSSSARTASKRSGSSSPSGARPTPTTSASRRLA
jgi:dihydrolipoamide dehydrogenase